MQNNMAKKTNLPQTDASAASGALPIQSGSGAVQSSGLQGLQTATSKGLTANNLLILTLATAAGYFVFGLLSPGLYQQDEAAHFLSMLSFWSDPSIVLSNWAKPGYKVLYALPALGGRNAVMATNCIMAAFTAFFVYKAAEKRGIASPVTAFLLLATQPFWIMLAFRNYSEIPTAFLLALGYFCYVSDRKLLSALCISYICTIRQEFYPIAAIFGLFLLWKKQWIPAVSLAVFPICQNIWGWLAKTPNDPLYLYNQIFSTDQSLKDAWPRQGFDHYFKTSIVVFGPVAVTLFVAYMGLCLLKNRRPDWLILVPALAYFLLNCLFNWQGRHVGPSTGGNLRYLLVISPFLALAGAAALDEFKTFDRKYRLLFVLVPLMVLVGLYMNYKHNYMVLTEEHDAKPMLGVILTTAALYIPAAAVSPALLFGGLMVFTMLLNVRPKKQSEEDKTCKTVAKWYAQNETELDKKPFYLNHTMLYYYLGKTTYQFPIKPIEITQAAMDTAPKGAMVIWDSHYSYRPNMKRGLNYNYFLDKPDTYRKIDEVHASDNTFVVLIFEKVK